MTLLAWLFGLIVLIVAIAVTVAFLNHFYRKTSRDAALIRTGSHPDADLFDPDRG